MKLSQIKNIAVVGSGIMGHGIGQTFALGGYEVTLNDTSEALLNKAVQQIRSNLSAFVQFGMTTPEGAKEALSRIKTNRNLKEAAGESDFVVEALPEVMDLKKRLFQELDEYCPSHTIFASNTSGLSLTEMASGIKRRDRAIIAHWWNPPHIIPAVEIVKGRYTSDQTVDLVYQLLVHIGKKPVKLLKEVPGFLGTGFSSPYTARPCIVSRKVLLLLKILIRRSREPSVSGRLRSGLWRRAIWEVLIPFLVSLNTFSKRSTGP